MRDPVSARNRTFYNTGDLAKLTSNSGELVFVGRTDNQLKLSGQLVVTEEIAIALETVANGRKKIPYFCA